MKVTQAHVGIAVTVAALLAVGTWGYSTTRGSGIPVYNPPYRAFVDCMNYSSKTGRTRLHLVIRNITKRPIRFRGNVVVSIRLDLATTPDGRHHWRQFAVLDAQTPLVTIPPRTVYRWSRLSRRVLLHGSTRHLEAGSCGFDADPPRLPG